MASVWRADPPNDGVRGAYPLDMRQRIRFCTAADGVRLATATSGSGVPLVKAAHYLTHVEHDWDSPVWRHWLGGLSDRFHLVRYDERGCGLSDREVDDFSMDAWVADLEAVVDGLGLERFALLGVSQGGAVAATYAALHPGRVSHLVLYGAYAQGRFRRGDDPADREEAEMFLDLIRLGWGRDNAAFRQVFTSLFIPEGTPEQVEWFNELQRTTASPENAARFEEAFYEIDVVGHLAGIDVPTLVMHATGDAMVPFDEGRRLAALVPDARFVPLDSSNHILLEEPAFDRFLEEITSFVGVPETVDAVLDRLTGREREVLALIARGRSNAELAEELTISPHTVRNHINRIFTKIGVADRSQAIVLARDRGLVPDRPPS